MTTDAQAQAARLEAMRRYDVLRSPPDESFDRVTRLACAVLDVPMSTISFVNGERMWTKSQQGGVALSPESASAFFDVAVHRGRPLVVADAWEDARFRTDPAVLGSPFIRFFAAIPLRTHDGHVLGALCAIDEKPRSMSSQAIDALSDLARIVMTELELRRTALTDLSTGAMSRRCFRDEARRAFGFARRHRSALSCVAFEIDRWAEVNDEHGHAAADLVRAETAATAQASLRAGDRLGRVGGETFAVLLPLADEAGAAAMAVRLAAAIAVQRVDGFSDPLAVTASIGCATLDDATASADDLIDRAVAALRGEQARRSRPTAVPESRDETRLAA